MNIILSALFMVSSLRKILSEDANNKSLVEPLSVHHASVVIEKVLKGYRDEVGPIIDGKPVKVAVNIFINDMMPTTTADMHFSLDCYLRMSWVDPRLSFNATSKDVFIPFESKFYEKIWTPNLYFPNGKKGFIHPLTKPNIFVKVHSDGRVFFSERLSLVSFCPMNMSYYPFDIQRCNLTIEDYSNPVEYLRLTWMHRPYERPKNLNSKDFARIKLRVSNTTRVGDFKHKFDRLIIHFKLYRDLKLYVLRDFLPCILIVMMSWITFWINHNSIPARVCLGITTVLTTVSMTNSIQKVNPVSSTLRSLDVFLLICLLFVFGALLELALTGMADPRGTTWWKSALKRREEGTEGESDILKENAETPIHTEEGKNKKEFFKTGEGHKGPVQLLSIRPTKRCATGPMAEPSETPLAKPSSAKDTAKKNVKFVGPFVFLHSEPHIIDRYAKICFPTVFVVFLMIFFLFHYFMPNTVGGSDEDEI